MVDNVIIPNLSTNNIKVNNHNCNKIYKKFHIKPVSEEELNKIILSFKNKYSSGYDEIPMPVIKHASKYLIKPIAHVINSSFVTGIFPNKLKISKIVTIFKKGNTNDPVNYRPLSILPAMSKIYERVMYVQFVKFLENNNLFDIEQHGFRMGRSTVTAGIDFIDSIVDAIDGGNNATGIFMDLSKAFDSVEHKQLIESLQKLGIEGLSLNWFSSYISNRKQYVEMKYVNKQNLITSVRSSMQGLNFGPYSFSLLLERFTISPNKPAEQIVSLCR